MADLVPHPLVAALAQGLGKSAGKASFVDLYNDRKITSAYAETPASGSQTYSTEATTQAAQAPGTLAQDLADELAKDSNLPELIAFAGFVGGIADNDSDAENETWRLLYLDSKLLTWMLVKRDDILLRCRVKDETAPFGIRDVIWLKSDATVSHGSGAPQHQEIHARFLRGDFVRAADFVATLSGGTFAPAVGLLGEAFTPACCGRPTRRP